MANRELQQILNSGELDSIFLGGTGSGDSVVKQDALSALDAAKSDKPFIVLQISDETNQLPSGLNTALQVKFGGVYAVNDWVSLAIDGTITFLRAGHYHVETRFQVGRVGTTGTSLLLVRCLKNDVQLGGGSAFKLADSEVLSPCSAIIHYDALVNDTIKFQILRDAAGDNSGGLYVTDPSDGWNIIPSANITITKIG